MSMRRRALRLRPVNSLKHIVETNGIVSGASASTTDVINTKTDPDTAVGTNQVNVGSTVHAIYLRVEVVGATSAGGVDNIYMGVFKNPGALLSAPPMDNVGATDRRKFMIHQEMIMLTPRNLSTEPGFPRTMFKGVIVIPKGYKRNGIEDKLQVILQHRSGESTQATNFCIECIYKEFY